MELGNIIGFVLFVAMAGFIGWKIYQSKTTEKVDAEKNQKDA